jgi:hypothetical protein
MIVTPDLASLAVFVDVSLNKTASRRVPCPPRRETTVRMIAQAYFE